MKRLICFAALLACLSFSAFAVPKVDGILYPYEYDETLSTLQIPQHEANNNLSFAYLHWAASPADHSVYLGVQYNCTDHTTEGGMTGVMVYVNDELIGTIYAGGAVEGVDHGRYELEGFLDDGAWGNPYDSICEVRAGVKFWPEGEITAGVQILDFGGNPSNYYRQTVYSPQAAATQDETTAARKTTTEKSTTAKPTTTTTTKAETTVTETTTRPVRTTAPVITAAAKGEPAATTAAASTAASAAQPTVLQPAPVPSKAAASSKTTKPKTKKAETTKTTTSKSSDAAETSSDPAGAVLPATAATTETPASETASVVSTAKMYNEANKAKIVGTVLVAVILTAAIMASVFLGMRQKKDEPQHTPQEEYDDFG